MPYPSSIETFTRKVDYQDRYNAAHINELQSIAEKIQTELGTDPAGQATDLKTRLANSLVFNVKDYGATGDGVTDDGTAIASAISALSAAGGGQLFLPRGTYRVTSSLSIPSNAMVYGEGTDSTVFLDGPVGEDAAIIAKGSASAKKSNVIFCDFKVTMDTSYASDAIQFYYVDYGIIENCHVENIAGFDVTVTTSTAATTTYTTTTAVDATAWDLSEAVVGQQASAGGNTGTIIDVDDANNTVTVDGWSPSTPGNGTACAIKAKDEIIEEGIALYHCTYCKVTCCTTKWVTQAGVEIAGGQHNIVAKNHLLFGPKAPGGATYTDGIYLWGARDVIVKGNICRGNYGSGIRMRSGGQFTTQVENISIIGNNCSDNLRFGIVGEPAAGNKGPAGVTIIGNICRNNSQEGINILNSGSMGDSKDIIISNNLCIDNVDDGILLAVVTQSIVTENICRNNDDGIVLINADENIIARNICADNASDGIYVDASSDDNIIADNLLTGNVSKQLNEAGGADNTIRIFADGDTTPSVKNGDIFKTANTGATTISIFDDGIKGQKITVIIGDANTVIDFTGTNLKGNSGVDWSPTTNDHLSCVFDGTNWYCDISKNV